jgi:cytochrome c peroxidase
MNNTKLIAMSFVLLLLFSCRKEIDPSKTTLMELPQNFPAPIYNNTQNPLSIDGIALGRKLFYDKNLSLSGNVSCGSCHAQVHAFADHNTPTSFGIYGRTSIRNSPSISNVAWQPNFMWDGGINHLDVMPIAPFTDKNEMGLTLNQLIEKVSASSIYKTLIKKAFNVDVITEKEILFAISQFMRTLVSANSKYDHVKLGKANFTIQEQLGYELFKTNCAQCHSEPFFTNFDYANNGAINSKIDSGRMRVTQLEKDRNKFKIPSLRNVALTYPYMHNGSFNNLTDVINHYSNVQNTMNQIDPRIKVKRYTEEEKTQLISFLNTLTDYKYISNYQFSEP